MLRMIILGALLSTLAQAAEFTLPPDKAKQYADLYCKDLTKSNGYIAALNSLTLANNQKLKKGSYALYEGQRQSYDAQGKPGDVGQFVEKWRVIEVKDQLAVVAIEIDGKLTKEITRDLTKGLFNATLSVEQPLHCLYWANFAAEITELNQNVGGKPVKVLMRKQAMLGNVEPVFTYAEGVPFDLAAYVETTHLQGKKEVVEKKLREFSF